MSSLKYTQLLSLEVLSDNSACLIHSEARSSTTRDARDHCATSSMLEDWGQDSTHSEDPPLTTKDAWAASATSSTRSTTQHSIHSEDPPPTTRDVSDPGATSSTWARRNSDKNCKIVNEKHYFIVNNENKLFTLNNKKVIN